MNYPSCIDRIGIEFEGLYTSEAIDELNGIDKYISDYGHDGTISYGRLDSSVYEAYEIKTAPLKKTGLEIVLSTFDKLYQDNQYVVNASCGLHFHISLNDRYFANVCSPEFYDNMILLLQSKYTKVFDDRKNSQFCFYKWETDRNNNTIEDIARWKYRQFAHGSSDRYHAVNYSVEDETDTVEIRLYGGKYATIKELGALIQDTINLMDEFSKKSFALTEPVDMEILDGLTTREYVEPLQQISGTDVVVNASLLGGTHQEYVARRNATTGRDYIFRPSTFAGITNLNY